MAQSCVGCGDPTRLSLVFNVHHMLIKIILAAKENPMESRTARLTLLIDPNKKAVFERLCAQADVTPSQLVRKFIRDYIEQQLGPDWREQVFAEGDDSTDDPQP